MQGHLRFRESAIDNWLRAQEVELRISSEIMEGKWDLREKDITFSEFLPGKCNPSHIQTYICFPTGNSWCPVERYTGIDGTSEFPNNSPICSLI